MVFHRSFRSKLPAALALFGLLAYLPGCPLSPESDSGGPKEDTRLVERNTIDGTLQRLTQVWEQKLYREYELLLHTEFTFWILDEDAVALPWLPEPFWGRTEELDFASNMFDPNFTGANPPVQSIEWDFNVLNVRPTTDASGAPVTEVTTDASITVLSGPNDGFRSDTRFVFDIVKDPNNADLFQIKRQQEVLKL